MEAERAGKNPDIQPIKKEKAENIAKSSGIRLVRLIDVSEGYYPVYNYGGGTTYEKSGIESAPAPEIQPGQQEVEVTMTLTYKIR